MQKIFVSKYALTKGILEMDATIKEDMAVVPSLWGAQYFHKGEWHLDKDAAVNQAEQMRHSRIVSLKKSIQKLEKISFT